MRYREVKRKRTDLVEEQRSIAVWVNGSLVREGVTGLHIEGYSVPCVLDIRKDLESSCRTRVPRLGNIRSKIFYRVKRKLSSVPF